MEDNQMRHAGRCPNKIDVEKVAVGSVPPLTLHLRQPPRPRDEREQRLQLGMTKPCCRHEWLRRAELGYRYRRCHAAVTGARASWARVKVESIDSSSACFQAARNWISPQPTIL